MATPLTFLDVQADKALVLASGGLDSAYALWRMSQVCSTVVVHHVFAKHIDHAKAQRTALHRQLQYYTNLNYYESVYSFSGGDLMGTSDFDFTINLSMPIAKAYRIAHIVTGDDIRSRMNGYWTSAVSDPAPRVALQDLHLVCRADNEDLVGAYLTMPPHILEVTWSCRAPVVEATCYHKCGECVACMLHKQTGLWEKLPQSMPIYPTCVAVE